MKNLMENDPRYPTGFLNFKRPVLPDPNRPVGPSLLNEYWWPVAVEKSGKGTRVGYSLVKP